MTLVPGTIIGHYEIKAQLGAGGMGEVYRATDRRLGRDVALKVLPAALATDPERRRRLQGEARTVAALNHQNIVTIHSVEEEDGIPFITMELVTGQPLSEKIPAGGMTDVGAVSVGLQLASALAAAHGKGIVHRDLKPANVMITPEGQVKVLDFGLAKAIDAAPGSDPAALGFTRDNIVMGTMPYMSPEQVEGWRVDHRSDIFSFGTILYEMTTGARPFHGASVAALLSSILRDAPKPPSSIRKDTKPSIGQLLGRCLEKDRERRIQTASELRDELDRIRGELMSAPGPAAVERKSIVVIPFTNTSNDPENEYFSDGLTEELIADLVKVKALRVISRTSSMQLKGTRKDVPTIGRELGVGSVVEGSVRKAGQSLRITAQLIDAISDANVWSEKYSGTMDEVFEVQERVSREIVKALNITLSSDEHALLADRPIEDPRGLELYMRARQALRRYHIDAAVVLAREAIQINGETPALQALLTMAKVLMARAGINRAPALFAEIEREASALAPDLPAESAVILGSMAYEQGRLPEGVRQCRRALELDPNSDDAHLYLCLSAFCGGQNDLARTSADRFLTQDPLSPMAWMASGVQRWFVNRAPDAIEELERALSLDPGNLIVLWTLAYTCTIVTELSQARHFAERLGALAPDLPYARQALGLLDALEGRRAEALARIDPIDTTNLDCHHKFHFAEAYAAAGEIERALDLLEESVSGFYPYPYMAEYCRLLDPMRASPRFPQILEQARQNAERAAMLLRT
jgi:serine/threonine protein kinase/tetratricopeptide (TPR) repeat protein